MGMGTRQSQAQQEEMWIANVELARSPGHPFYQRLNGLLDEERFDAFVEGLCSQFYAPTMGRPGLVPGVYFRSLLIGYFEGIDSERGIAWRMSPSRREKNRSSVRHRAASAASRVSASESEATAR